MTDRRARSHVHQLQHIRIGLVAAALFAAGAAPAQPSEAAASAAVAASAAASAAAPARRPAPTRQPPPLGADPANQPGLGKPVTPQLRIPLGKKPPPANPASGPR